jgi:hypothetical protein
LRNRYAKGPQRDGVVRDRVARGGQQFQAERLLCHRSRENFVEMSLQLGDGVCAHGNGREMPQLGNEHGHLRVCHFASWQGRRRKQQSVAARIKQDGGGKNDLLGCAFFVASGKQVD